MDLQLAGQVVLVTGAGQGIGRAVANAFAAEGAAVAFHHNTSAEGAQAAAAQVVADGGRAIPVQADISDQAAIEAMVDTVTSELGPIDVLVNNAAYTQPGRFLDMDPDSWQRMVEVTVVGMMRVTQAVLRGMVERESGSIVSLMGDSGRVGESRLAAVATTRGSTSALMKSIAKEHGRHGIRANTVSLGLVQSEKFEHHTDNADEERMKRIVAMYPLGRVGQPADVPPLVLLLASPLASWITGQVVSINGGYSMV